jgi:hypothetical protein
MHLNKTAAGGAMLFMALGIAIAFTRHFYDDEVATIQFISNTSFWAIWSVANSMDVHPPLSYLINRMFWWPRCPELLFMPSILLNAATTWYFYRAAEPLTRGWQARTALFLLTFCNPELLMWGVSIRWYALFIPITTLMITRLLFYDVNRRAILISVLMLAILTHTCYLTLFLLPVVFGLMAVRCGRANFRWVALGVAGYALLTAYQYYIFATVHSGSSSTQRGGLIIALVYTLTAVCNGSTVFPAEPVAIFKALMTLAVIGFGLPAIRRNTPNRRVLLTLAILIGFSFALLVLSGVGMKMRNASYLNPWFCLFTVLLLGGARQWLKTGFMVSTVLFTCLSLYNVLNRCETLKDRYNFPVRETVRILVEMRQKSPHQQMVVYTYEPTIAFELERKGFQVFSPTIARVDDLRQASVHPGDQIAFIHHEKGSWSDETIAAISALQQQVTNSVRGKISTFELGHNKWHALKSKLFRREFHPYYLTLTVIGIENDQNIPVIAAHKGPLSLPVKW